MRGLSQEQMGTVSFQQILNNINPFQLVKIIQEECPSAWKEVSNVNLLCTIDDLGR